MDIPLEIWYKRLNSAIHNITLMTNAVLMIRTSQSHPVDLIQLSLLTRVVEVFDCK